MTGNRDTGALGLVMERASLHQDELIVEREKARNLEPLGKIPPPEQDGQKQ